MRQRGVVHPYAAVTFSYDEYAAKVQRRFDEIDIRVRSIHREADPVRRSWSRSGRRGRRQYGGCGCAAACAGCKKSDRCASQRHLRASKVYHESLKSAENIEFVWDSTVTELLKNEGYTVTEPTNYTGEKLGYTRILVKNEVLGRIWSAILRMPE